MHEIDVKQLHLDTIVVDAVSPLARNTDYLKSYRDGHVNVVGPTVLSIGDARAAFEALTVWHRLLADRDDLLLLRTGSDIRRAKSDDRLGIFLHLQGTDAFEDKADLALIYKLLGIGMVQLTYNGKCLAGDGCEVLDDRGLTPFGREVVRRLNECGVIVDVSHCGERTSLDVISLSEGPVVASHSNIRAVHESPRNLSSGVVRAIADSGGLIGIAGFPAMVSAHRNPTIRDFSEHIDAVVQSVGIDHVGLGLDYFSGQAGVAKDGDVLRDYESAIASGVWGPAYPRPPYNYPERLELPSKMMNLTLHLIEIGYQPEDVKKILGGNWVRVMTSVWGD